jgi:hypothetical protein
MISLIGFFSDAPGIDRQIEMFNDGIQADLVFPILHCFQYQDNSCLPISLQSIVSALTHRLGPFVAEIKFNRMGSRQAIAAGAVRQCHFELTVVCPARLNPPLSNLWLNKF